MVIQRATRDINFKKYCNDESYLRNLSYICLDDNKEVVAAADFIILNQYEANLIHINILNNNETLSNLIHLFIDEFSYWNPFIKKVYYLDEIIQIQNCIELFQLPILEVQVEQLTVSKSKLDNVLRWIKSETDVIICVVKLDDKFVCIDGYSRLLAAHLNNFSNVYCYLEKDEYDEKDYKEFLNWCHDENIYSVKDLEKRVVSDAEHQRIWIDRCQNYFKNKKVFSTEETK